MFLHKHKMYTQKCKKREVTKYQFTEDVHWVQTTGVTECREGKPREPTV